MHCLINPTHFQDLPTHVINHMIFKFHLSMLFIAIKKEVYKIFTHTVT